MTKRRYPSAIHLLSVSVVFACATLIMTYPLCLRLKTHLAGDDYDVWARPWASWWTKRAISEGQAFYHTKMLFHPQGVSLVYHSFSHVNTAIALLVEPLLGFVAAHNVTVMLAYTLSGISMYFLARDITGSTGSGLVAGLIFAFSTYHVDQSSHLIILTTQWMPLWIMFVIRLFRDAPQVGWERRLFRQACSAALFLILTALSSWHLLIFSALWILLYLLYLLLWERTRLNLPSLSALIMMAAVTCVTIAPLLFPLLIEPLKGEAREWIQVIGDEELTTDLLAFFVPSRRHPVFGPLVEPIHQRIGRRQVFLGYTALALALIGAIKHWRRARFWALSTLIFLSISLGAYVRFNGARVTIASSERPLQPWLTPFTRLIRDPTRLTVMTMLGLAVLAAMGVAWLTQRRRASKFNVIAIVVAVLVLFEYLPLPLPTTRVEIPVFYKRLRREEGSFALADIPVRQLELRRLSMFYQIIHQKPIVEGIVGRTPPNAYAFIEQHPILSAFDSVQEGPDQQPPGDGVSRQLEGLIEANVRYLVLHRRFLTASEIEWWRGYLPYDPFYQDDQIIVYQTRPMPGEKLHVTLPINDTLGLAELRINTRYPHAGEPLSLDAAWVATRSPKRVTHARWSLVTTKGRVVQSVEGRLCSDWSPDDWLAGDFAWGRYKLPTAVSPGPYRLNVRLEPTGESRDVSSLLVLPTEGDLTTVDTEPVATFGKGILLDRLRVLRGDGMLHLYLNWQALRAIDRDYKLFIHLFDSSDELVSQLDTVPRDWTAPTSSWDKGTKTSDLVSLDIFGLPPGTYRLALGLYDAATQERLSLRLPDGSLAPNATLRKEIRLP